MSRIIGIHMGHDASVTLLENGRIEFCLSEERLVREKMYYGFPFMALEMLLNRYGISPGDVDALALDTNELPGLLGPDGMRNRFKTGAAKKISHQIAKSKWVLSYFLGQSGVRKNSDHEAEAKAILMEKLSGYGFRTDRIQSYDHHLCHAATAFWASPFQQALIVTSDGRGDGLSATLGRGEGSGLSRSHAVSHLDSIGQFYSAVTFYLGFRPNRHEGKITGLAAFGNRRALGDLFLSNVKWNADGSYEFRIPEKYRLVSEDDYRHFMKSMPLSLKDRIILHHQEDSKLLLYTANWYSLLWYLHDAAKGFSAEDVAAGVQGLVENVCAEFVRKNLASPGTPVVMAGGVFSNVSVNRCIRELAGVTGIYVQPAMGDEGLSLGGALLAYSRTAEGKASLGEPLRVTRMRDAYLGPEYPDEEIEAACKRGGVEAIRIPEQLESQIAREIHDGRIVGYYDGRMEFGPRALGHRSILVRPIRRDINKELNKRLRRTEFMPFAPSILAEHAGQYLKGYEADHVASEFMTVTYEIEESLRDRIQATVHVDGTARPQVVHAAKEEKYHRILSEYYRLSGIPAIVNTSFNMHEEPIVCTPEDAIRSYKAGCVDTLVMGSYMMRQGLSNAGNGPGGIS